MKTYLRDKRIIIEEKDSASLKFLYNTVIGRMLLKVLITKPVSKIFGLLTNTKLSRIFINKFVNKHNINLKEYKKETFKSFNDFFIRQIKPSKRPIASEHKLISVADARLIAYKIKKDLTINVKNSVYSIESLINDSKKAEEYKDGDCLVFRLCPDDYHHYVFLDDGKIQNKYHINGKLHTVQPLAYDKYEIFSENDREITFLRTKNYDEVAYIEVGALNIGKINNRNIKNYKKGEEKGYFSFGASTIILLIKKDLIKIDKDILINSKNHIETKVLMGEEIGKKKHD